MLHEIEAYIASLRAGRLLDVATGSGTFAEWLADIMQDCTDITGVDTRAWTPTDQPSVFDRPNAEYRQMDAHALDFADATFDTAAIAHSLHHVADPAAVLAEIRRVLKPGGHLVVQEMVRDGLTDEQQTHMLLHHWWAAVDRARGLIHNETYTRRALLDLIDTVALDEVVIFDYADHESDPKDAAVLAHLRDRLDQYRAYAEHTPQAEALSARADDLARRLDTVGFRSASVVIAVGKKPGV